VASADRSSRNLIRIKPSAELANPRFSLIIGNSAYPVGPLSNSQNDANDMTDALQRAGFKVTQLINATQRQMERAIIQFGQLLNQNNKSVGLFYYAGHGMQLGSNNYLIPIDAQLAVEDDIKYESVNVGRVLDAMDRAANRLNMVLLDACRDNPFARSFRSSAKGLAQMDAPSGTLIAYATAPGNTAADGIGRNGTFTKYLLKHMQRPGEPVELVLKRVRNDVMHETNHRQTPWESSSLVGNFSFVEGDSVIDIMTPSTPNPLLGRVIINSEPQQAKIYINDIYEGQAPLTLSLDLGVVTIRGDKKGYESTQEKVRIRQDRELKVSLLLNQVDVEQSTVEEPLAKHWDGEVFRDTLKYGGEGPEMVVIPAGMFRMGDIQGDGGDDEKPVHRVQIKSFAIGKTEVTFDEYDYFAEATGRKKSEDKGWGRGNRPAINVSWYNAVAYTKWLSQQTGQKYRLPSESEWEYAARSGSQTKYSWGNEIGRNKANCYGCGSRWDNEKTAPVVSFEVSGFDLSDVHGNVREWVQDCWNESYQGAPQDGRAWESGDCRRRVLRGGSWDIEPWNLRLAVRSRDTTTNRWSNSGFRLARTL